MKNRLKTILLLSMLIMAGVAAAGLLGHAEDPAPAPAAEKTIVDEPQKIFEDIQLLADTIALITTEYVEPVKMKDIVYGALRGMTGTLDGYSQFLDPQSFQEITEETQGEFGGVGLEIGMREGMITVISPMEDTPAFEAGIKPGDIILSIDGTVTRDMMMDDALSKLRGKAGTKVKLTVFREDESRIIDVELTRAMIKIKSIKDVKILEEGIGYIKLIEFQQRTPGDIKKSIDELAAKGAKGLVLDLRNNPGGLLDSAVGVAEKFLDPGRMIVYTEGRDPSKRMEFKSQGKDLYKDMVLVILVNKGSASAAEILAGAIKDNKRGIIVGTTTFGKGSVQTVIPLRDDSALRLTTAAYFTPAGNNIRDKGIEPDIIVKYSKPVKRSPEDKEQKRKLEIFAAFAEKGGKKEAEGTVEKVIEENAAEVSQEEKPMKDEKKEKGTGEEKAYEDKDYDSQVMAAVNIIKGLRIYEEYKVSSSYTSVKEDVKE